MAEYFFEMTYIPNLDEENFFVWFTDGKNNRDDLDASLLLTQSGWRFRYFRMSLRKKQVIFEDENGQRIEVSGCFLPMWEVFQFLLEGPRSGESEIAVGETYDFWRNLAACLSTLLEAGHYYPTLLTVEKENKGYAFSQWMLSRQTLASSNLFNEWIRSIPVNALSVLELASFPIRQWLDILLDSWADGVIRNLIAPSYPWRRSRATPDTTLKWFNDLKQLKNVCFLTTENPEVVSQLEKLEQQCDRWEQSIAGESRSNPKQTLKNFKYMKIGLDLEPVSLLLCMDPLNPNEPFEPDERWTLTLKVDIADEDGHKLVDGEEAWVRHLSLRQWMQKKFDKLAKFHPLFRTFGYQMYDNDFDFQCSSRELMEFYRDIREDDVQVQFPDWMKIRNRTDEAPEVRLQTEVDDGGRPFNLQSLVNFDWQISVGDLSIPLSQFKQLVERQQRFLRHHDEWVELPFEKMKAAYAEMTETNDMIGRKGNMSDLLRMSITEKEKEHHYVKLDNQAETKNYLKMLLAPKKHRKKVPDQFHGILRPYQQKGFTWLDELRDKGIGGCLADDMGLGKTIQTIAYLLSGSPNKNENPVLIICPTSLIENWKHEIERFAPDLRTYSHHGSQRLCAEKFQEQKSAFDVMITSYNLASRDSSWLSDEEWPSIIIDEAQAIKNPATQQSQVVRNLKGGHRIALTGTPMENKLEELWSIMDFLNPGYLGSMQGFRRNFIKPVERDNDQQKVKLLRRFIQPFLLRREKTDNKIINDLPDKTEEKTYCHLSEEQASLYQSVVNELMEKMQSAQGIARKGLILSSLTRLKQLCDHPQLVLKNQAMLDDSGKLVRFMNLLESLLQNGHSTLVFTQYVQMGHILKKIIAEQYPYCPVYFLHGSLPSVKREALIQEFRQNDHEAVFILSLKTGGVGLNLTEASDVIHYDRWWNPAVENQATDRTHRIGQNKNVHVYKLISVGTLEEKIDEMIEKKKMLTEQVIGRGDGWVTEMKDDEVYDLIRLREKVIAK